MCGKNVTEEGWHGFSCLKSAGRFSRHSNLNALIKQSLSSTHIPSVLEPRHLYRTDQKRPDGLKLVPWAVAKQLLWNIAVVDSLAPCRINAGSVCNPGTAAVESEERKNDKYKDLVDDGYLFEPLAFEIEGAAGPSSESFLKKLCRNLSICTEEPRACSFSKQRISLAIQIANAACVLGTLNDKITFDKIFYMKYLYIIFSRVELRVLIEETLKEEAESKRKAKKVIVWGVKKADEPKDKEFMLQLSADLGTDIEGTSTKRIGKENENGEQLILVSLTSELQAQNILKLAKKLKEFEHYTNIYINKDLTKS